jgi:hypothetical protein
MADTTNGFDSGNRDVLSLGEIEITPAMIEAGADVIETSPWFQGHRLLAERMASEVFMAMERVQHAAPAPSS